MTENAKTLLFGATAIVLAAVAFVVTRPSAPSGAGAAGVGQLLYPDFKDPLSAGSLEIFTYDPDTATPSNFKVALVNNQWVIPSHENYPTDAEKQLAGAAASVIDLEILEVKSDAATDHELYGVLDPEPSKNEIKSGSQGVGVKVALDSKSGKEIMRLIIGKEDPGQAGVRFVRRAGQDPVYLTKIDTAKLSTKFEDWIEPDLLKVNSWDITSIDIDNYSVNESARKMEDLIKVGDQISLTYDDAATENRWKLADLKEGEELNDTRLNEIRDALDDLRIVDVRRKPAGLTADLKTAEGIALDDEALISLQEKGFFVIEGTLKSNEGEAIVGTKEGVEYVMRFGEIAASTSPSPNSASPDNKDETSNGQNRYIFITAQFNPDRIEPPKLQPLPGAPAAEQPADTTVSTETAPAADTATETTTTTEDAEQTTKPTENPNACQETTATETEATAPADAATQAPDQVAADAVRQRIENENKRAQELYDQKVKDGQQKAKDLNDRFADWYYVISDDIFRKIKVSRADIIKGADPLTGEKNALEEFDQLKNALPAAPDALACTAARGRSAIVPRVSS